MCVGFHVKFLLFFSPVLARFELALQTHMKCHEKPSSGRGVVPCGRTDRRSKPNGRFWHHCDTVAGLGRVSEEPRPPECHLFDTLNSKVHKTAYVKNASRLCTYNFKGRPP